MAPVSFTAKFLFAIAAFFLVLSIGFEMMPARVAMDPSPYTRYAGAAPWTVAGVRPGDSVEAVIARLGPPERDNHRGTHRVVSWTSPEEVGVTATSTGEVVDVLGASLSAGGERLVERGFQGEAVEHILGSARTDRHYGPRGSGVITLGMKERGRTLRYDNAGVSFEVGVYEDRVSYVRALKPEVK